MTFWINDDYLNDIWERGLADPIPEDRDKLDLYPSYMGCRDKQGNYFGNCIRKAYYSKVDGDIGSIDISGSMIMAEGNLFESHAATVFMAAGVAIRPNPTHGQPRIIMPRRTPNGVEYNVVARLDMIYRNSQGQRAILDFKRPVTKNSIDYTLGTGFNKGFGPRPKEANVIQMAVYSDWGRSVGISDCKLAYAMPSERKGIVFKIRVDSEGQIFVDERPRSYTLHDIYKEFDALADAISSGNPPEKPFSLFYSEDELDAIAMVRDIPKTWRDKLQRYGKVVKSYNDSPCYYCEYCAQCHGLEDAELAVKIQS